ncbi:MAG: protein kinase [Myxococcales bacterium]|nr:protein kinase [Myxococcales bacterium]
MGNDVEREGESSGDSSAALDALLQQVAKVSVGPGLSASLAAGQKLVSGRFTVLGRIGEGGMGAVYEAFDEERRERVALKTLTKVSPAGVYRLKQEFRSLADVRHENLVKLHELFADGELWFFTMELVERQPMDRWLRPEGELDEGRLRSGLAQLTAAVEAIHAARKLHRDLKPSNVMVDAGGRVVVLDFGLAADPEVGGVGQTVTQESISGTPAYMAPEQAAGKRLSEATDWYAVGVMLFEALTGRLPFEGSTAGLLVAKQTGEPPAPANLRTDVPAAFDRLCVKLLARDSSQRADGRALRAVVGQPAEPAGGPTPEAGLAREPATELLGRDGELEELRAAHEAARDGRKPVVVLLAGESGIGKSALCEHFLRAVGKNEPAVILSGRCYERESVPFKGFDALVDALSRYLRRLGPDAAGLLPRDAWALRRLFPVLSRLDALAAQPERHVDDAHELRRRAFSALGELLGRMRDRVPLIVHIDDLQWSDADSTSLLMHLLRQVDAPHMLCILGHRSENMEDNPQLVPLYELLPHDNRIDCRTLALGPLSEAAAAQLAACHDEALLRDAGGNPFLLGELARLARSGVTVKSLAEAIRARQAALPEAERRLLEVFALCGERTPIAVAAQAAGVTEQAHAAVDALRGAGLLRSSAGQGAAECYHDRIREAVAASLDSQQRRALHLALAEALLARGEADPERLATHLLGAEQYERATPYAVEAADRAADALAFERAAELYALALEHGTLTHAEVQALRAKRAAALARAGLGVLAARAFLLAREHATPEQARRLTQSAAEQFVFSGHVERGKALFGEVARALDIPPPRGQAVTVAAIAVNRAVLRLRGLSFRERGPASGTTGARLELLRRLADTLSLTETVTAMGYAARYLRMALASGDPTHVVHALGLSVGCGAMAGANAEQLREMLDRAEDLASTLGDPDAQRGVLLARGGFEWLAQSEPDAAVTTYDQLLALFREQTVQDVSHYEAWTQLLRCAVRALGLLEVAIVAEEVPVLVDAALARSDLSAAPMLVGAWFTWVRQAMGDVEGMAADLERVKRLWPGGIYNLQAHYLATGEIDVRCAQSRYLEAIEVGERALCLLDGPSRRRIPHRPLDLLRRMAMATAALAHRSSSPSERARWLRQADTLLERMARIKPAANPAHAMDVGPTAVALARGDNDTAVACLRRLGRPGSLHSIRFVEVSARYVLGCLLGGDEGQSLREEAEAQFSRSGVPDVDALAWNTVVGFRVPTG